jgi:hypothetical protein
MQAGSDLSGRLARANATRGQNGPIMSLIYDSANVFVKNGIALKLEEKELKLRLEI